MTQPKIAVYSHDNDNDNKYTSPVRTKSYKASKSCIDTAAILDTVTDTGYITALNTPSMNMPSRNMDIITNSSGISPNSILTMTSQSDAPQPPSPLQELAVHQNNITPASSPAVENINDNESKQDTKPPKIMTQDVKMRENEGDENETTIMVLTEDDNNKNFYVHCSPVTSGREDTGTPPEAETTPDTLTKDESLSNDDTFVCKESEDELSQLSDSNVTSVTITSITHPIDNTENVNDNLANNKPITPPIDSMQILDQMQLNIIEESKSDSEIATKYMHPIRHSTVPSLTELLKNIDVKHYEEQQAENDEPSQSIMTVTDVSLNSISDTIGKPEESQQSEEISKLSTNTVASTTLNSFSPENEVEDTSINPSESDNVCDIILPQIEPSKPEMRAPKPMMMIGPNGTTSTTKPTRRHSYNYDRSRTDLQLDASGDNTTSGSGDDANNDDTIHDALESSSGGDLEYDLDELESTCSETMDDSQSDVPSPIKTVRPRSSEVQNELQQRKTAMDSHYIIPHYYQAYIWWYFGISILIMCILIITVAQLQFDTTPKYVNNPRFDQHSFLRDECREKHNNDSYILNEEYFLNYGYQFVETKYYSFHNDAVHWMILSVIGIATMIFIYPIGLLLWSIGLIFRYEYYKTHGVDPLFGCKCCPIYQRYSSPNAPYLSSVLDPHNLYLFNHSISPGISPNTQAKIKKLEAKIMSHSSGCTQKIKLETVKDDEAVYVDDNNKIKDGVFFAESGFMEKDGDDDNFEDIVNSDSGHSMGVEPPSPWNDNGRDNNDKGIDQDGNSASNGEEEEEFEEVGGNDDVLRQTLLNLEAINNDKDNNNNTCDVKKGNENKDTSSYVD